ncbi:LLM class F420-dependent oxidoreductase [Amycolatopsis sp. GM8]|uniref:LLM class F420-dependent oxidoreductase n=1 Tax=Amycolatopsis sp. GM8 TaxID=2896530 RepID=UPI001F3D164F|nr:LLM class F420-dependent oxidoreductase [Amycolatopsis sp. GM8]
MKFDVQHAVADPKWTPAIISPAAMTRFARAAEESGYGALGFTDHPAPSGKWVRSGGEGSVDPFSALGFCAAVTSAIRLLTWVLVLPYRNPMLTAHQTASLDALSGGRLTVGVGTGYLRGEFRALGIDFSTRREAFDEAIEVMRAAWSDGDVTYQGQRFEAKENRVQPSPVQRPGPPLLIHGNSPFGLERAARYGSGWMAVLATGRLAETMRTAPIDGFDELARRIEKLRELTEKEGRPADAVEVSVSGRWGMLDARRGWDTARIQDDVAALEARGVDRVVMVICGDDPGAAEDTVRRFGEEFALAPGRPGAGTR